MDGFLKLASIDLDLVHFDCHAHHGSLDDQVVIVEQADVLQQAHLLKLDEAVRRVQLSCKVKEIFFFIALLDKLCSNLFVLCDLIFLRLLELGFVHLFLLIFVIKSCIGHVEVHIDVIGPF